MMRNFFALFFLICVISVKSQIRKYSNEFLNIGVGARALGMANANIVSSEGAYAGYWNPANLLKQKTNIEVALMHAEYFAGIAKYDFIGVSKKIDTNSIVALSILRFGVDNIPNTLDLVDVNGNIDYNRISTFNAIDFAALLSYSRHLNIIKGLTLGGNFKIIRRKIGEFGGAWGLGIDIAANYNYKKWQLAAMAKDVTGTFNVWNFNLSQKQIETFTQTGNQIPSQSLEITTPKLIIGAARTHLLWKNKISILGEINLINSFDGQRNTVFSSNVWSLEPNFGLEIGYLDFIFLRAGLGNIQKQLNDRATLYITTAQPNFGLGFKYKIFNLDYAITNIGDQSTGFYSNIFSLKIDVNRK